MPDPEPLTAEELEERRQNLAFIRKNCPEGDHTFTTTLVMQEQWLATIDAERLRAERSEQERDDWKATAEAAMAEPQLKLLADRAERAEAQVGRLVDLALIRFHRETVWDILAESEEEK